MAAKQKILIVDDDNNIAELISLYLTKECFDTKIVNDGEEALKAFEQYSPNLILLDLMLPGIDGYQVCREVRAKANVPIIMLSAKGEIFDKVLGLELGNGGLVLGGAAGAHAVFAVALGVAMAGEAQRGQALRARSACHILQGIFAIAHGGVAMDTGLLIICHNCFTASFPA